jgi:hypothetical protein
MQESSKYKTQNNQGVGNCKYNNSHNTYNEFYSSIEKSKTDLLKIQWNASLKRQTLTKIMKKFWQSKKQKGKSERN